MEKISLKQFIKQSRQQFKGKTLTYLEFLNFNQDLSQIDERYFLEEQILIRLWEILLETQNNKVNFSSIEAILKDFVMNGRESIFQSNQSKMSNISQQNNNQQDQLQLNLQLLNEIKRIYNILNPKQQNDLDLFNQIFPKCQDLNTDFKIFQFFADLSDNENIVKPQKFQDAISFLEKELIQQLHQDVQINQNSNDLGMSIKLEQDQDENQQKRNNQKDNNQQSQDQQQYDDFFQDSDIENENGGVQASIKQQNLNNLLNLFRQKIDQGIQESKSNKAIVESFNNLIQIVNVFEDYVIKSQSKIKKQFQKIQNFQIEKELLQSRVNQFEQDYIAIQEYKLQSNKEFEELSTKLEKYEHSDQEKEKKIRQQSKQLERISQIETESFILKKKIEQQNQQLEQLKEESSELKSFNSTLNNQNENLNSVILSSQILSSQIQDPSNSKINYKQNSTEFELINSEKNQLLEQIKLLQNQINAFQSELEQKDSQIYINENKINSLQQEIDDLIQQQSKEKLENNLFSDLQNQSQFKNQSQFQLNKYRQSSASKQSEIQSPFRRMSFYNFRDSDIKNSSIKQLFLLKTTSQENQSQIDNISNELDQISNNSVNQQQKLEQPQKQHFSIIAEEDINKEENSSILTNQKNQEESKNNQNQQQEDDIDDNFWDSVVHQDEIKPNQQKQLVDWKALAQDFIETQQDNQTQIGGIKNQSIFIQMNKQQLQPQYQQQTQIQPTAEISFRQTFSLLQTTNSLMSSQNQRYLKVNVFDEELLYARDFLNLRDTQPIQKILERNGKNEDLTNLKSFSDDAFVINSKGSRKKRILFCTSFNIYILKTNRSLDIIRIIPIQNIQQITFSSKTSDQCLLHIKDEYDLLLEIYRRIDMNLFFLECFKQRNLTLYGMDFKNDFKIYFRNSISKDLKDLKSDNKQYSDFQGAYKDANKIGWLDIHQKKLFQKQWKRMFVVLTNVGILLFKEPGQQDAQLIPISGANLILNPLNFQNKFSIKIGYLYSENEVVFSSQSKSDQYQWYDAIHSIIKQSLNKDTIKQELLDYTQNSNLNEEKIIEYD